MDEEILITREDTMYAMKEKTDIIKGAFVIIMLEGEITVDVQESDCCKPKSRTLTKSGSNIYIPPNTTYRIRNNQLLRARWIEVHQNPDMF